MARQTSPISQGVVFGATEAVFQEAPGVTSVVSGYMQRAETIQITFDPSKTSYDKLLNLFLVQYGDDKKQLA